MDWQLLIAGVIVAAAVVRIIIKINRRRKRGSGCDCCGCNGCDHCNKK